MKSSEELRRGNLFNQPIILDKMKSDSELVLQKSVSSASATEDETLKVVGFRVKLDSDEHGSVDLHKRSKSEDAVRKLSSSVNSKAECSFQGHPSSILPKKVRADMSGGSENETPEESPGAKDWKDEENYATPILSLRLASFGKENNQFQLQIQSEYGNSELKTSDVSPQLEEILDQAFDNIDKKETIVSKDISVQKCVENILSAITQTKKETVSSRIQTEDVLVTPICDKNARVQKEGSESVLMSTDETEMESIYTGTENTPSEETEVQTVAGTSSRSSQTETAAIFSIRRTYDASTQTIEFVSTQTSTDSNVIVIDRGKMKSKSTYTENLSRTNFVTAKTEQAKKEENGCLHICLMKQQESCKRCNHPERKSMSAYTTNFAHGCDRPIAKQPYFFDARKCTQEKEKLFCKEQPFETCHKCDLVKVESSKPNRKFFCRCFKEVPDKILTLSVPSTRFIKRCESTLVRAIKILPPLREERAQFFVVPAVPEAIAVSSTIKARRASVGPLKVSITFFSSESASKRMKDLRIRDISMCKLLIFSDEKKEKCMNVTRALQDTSSENDSTIGLCDKCYEKIETVAGKIDTVETPDMDPETPITTADLGIACRIISDHLLNLHSVNEDILKKSSQVLRRKWFDVVSDPSSDISEVVSCLKYFEEFSQNLLRALIHLVDHNGNNVLHFAFANDRFDLAEHILKYNHSEDLLKHANKSGNTPLMICAVSNPKSDEDWTVIRKAFQVGNVNASSGKSGQTALMNAASRDFSAMVRLLLEMEADPNVQDSDGSTALMYAAEHGHIESTKLLVRHPRCDPTIKDFDNESACSIALSRGYTNIAVIVHLIANERQKMCKTSSYSKHNAWWNKKKCLKPGSGSQTPPTEFEGQDSRNQLNAHTLINKSL